jgi:hypothetical protein
MPLATTSIRARTPNARKRRSIDAVGTITRSAKLANARVKRVAAARVVRASNGT